MPFSLTSDASSDSARPATRLRGATRPSWSAVGAVAVLALASGVLGGVAALAIEHAGGIKVSAHPIPGIVIPDELTPAAAAAAGSDGTITPPVRVTTVPIHGDPLFARPSPKPR